MNSEETKVNGQTVRCPLFIEMEETFLIEIRQLTAAVQSNALELRATRESLIPAATNKGYMPVATHQLIVKATLMVLGIPLSIIILILTANFSGAFETLSRFWHGS